MILLSFTLSATPFTSSFSVPSNPGGPAFLGVALLCGAGDTGADTTLATSSGTEAACSALGSTFTGDDLVGRGETGGCSAFAVLLLFTVVVAAAAAIGGVCIGSRYRCISLRM